MFHKKNFRSASSFSVIFQFTKDLQRFTTWPPSRLWNSSHICMVPIFSRAKQNSWIFRINSNDMPLRPSGFTLLKIFQLHFCFVFVFSCFCRYMLRKTVINHYIWHPLIGSDMKKQQCNSCGSFLHLVGWHIYNYIVSCSVNSKHCFSPINGRIWVFPATLYGTKEVSRFAEYILSMYSLYRVAKFPYSKMRINWHF